MKYALAEQKNIELLDKIQKLETSVTELCAEKENLLTYLNTLRTEKQKLKEVHDKKVRLYLFYKMISYISFVVAF